MTPLRRRTIRSQALAVALTALAACSATPGVPTAVLTPAVGPAPTPDDAKADPTAAELLKLHNDERAKAKLPPLALNPKLSAAAARHARDMAEHAKMSHEGSDGSTPRKRVEDAGYKGQATGENVATGQQTAADVMSAWMESPPHKKNIIGDFGEMGAALAKDADGQPYWAVEFGKPWPDADPAAASRSLLDAINEARKDAKLPPLKSNPKLAKIAQEQAKASAAKPASKLNGQEIFDKIDASGYKYAKVGMTAASGEPTAADVLDVWMGDPNTKKNLLDNFNEAGVGYAPAADGSPYWFLILGRPR